MTPTQRTDTPETDAEILQILIDRGVVDHRNAPENLVVKSRSLERERNEARELLREIAAADWKTAGELRCMARRGLEARNG